MFGGTTYEHAGAALATMEASLAAHDQSTLTPPELIANSARRSEPGDPSTGGGRRK